MAKSKKDAIQEEVQSNLGAPTLYFPESRPAIVDSNPVVRRVGQILQNGTTSANHPHVNFAAHTSLYIRLRNAYESLDQEEFFTVLREYLVAAQGHIRHAMAGEEEVDLSIAELKRLVAQLEADGKTRAFSHVAGYLLLVGRAPFDHL